MGHNIRVNMIDLLEFDQLIGYHFISISFRNIDLAQSGKI